jgi:hypothetical protein
MTQPPITHNTTTAAPPHFTPAEIDALAAFVNANQLVLRRKEIPTDDATLTGLILRDHLAYDHRTASYNLRTATLLDLARQLYNERPSRPADEHNTEEGRIFQLFSEDDATWFVRFLPDSHTGKERITVYYKQTRNTARYIVADSRDTDALAGRQPHRGGFIGELCTLMAQNQNPADFPNQVHMLLEHYGHDDLYDAAYDHTQAQEEP